MVDQAKSLAGRKGGAVRRARKQAQAEGVTVHDQEFGFLAMPDGTITEIGQVALVGATESKRETHPATEAAELTNEPDVDAGGKLTKPPEELGEPEPDPDADVTFRDDAPDAVEVEQPNTDTGIFRPTLIEQLQTYQEQGLSEQDALTLINAKQGMKQAPPRGPEQAATASQGEELGPDKALVAAYNKKMLNYVEPKLELKLTLENPDGDDFTAIMPIRYLDYLNRAATLETVKRRREVNIADFIQMIVRRYKANDPDTALLMNTLGGTGPADTFNQQTGQYG